MMFDNPKEDRKSASALYAYNKKITGFELHIKEYIDWHFIDWRHWSIEGRLTVMSLVSLMGSCLFFIDSLVCLQLLVYKRNTVNILIIVIWEKYNG